MSEDGPIHLPDGTVIRGPAALERHMARLRDPVERAKRLPTGKSLSSVNTAAPADPWSQRRHDDPWRYAALVTDEERESMQRWAHNYWATRGKTFPVPSALYDLLKASGVDVTYMHPIKATFF
jgi:hypothetical protein